MTAGMVGFGSLLWARRRLRGPEAPLAPAPRKAAQAAGRALLLISGVIAVLVAGIVSLRLRSALPIGALSLWLPAVGLSWLALLGLQVRRHREAAPDSPAGGDRPSRRPPARDNRAASPSSHSGPPDQHVNA